MKLYSRKVQQAQGVNVYSRKDEWELLVILDAARVDSLRELSHEIPFLDQSDEITSVASSSSEWMRQTFTEEYRSEMQQTTYICSNPFSDDVLSASRFDQLVEVWRDDWDDGLGTVPARAVTDAAVDSARSDPSDRMIVHYMQPHFPSVPHGCKDGSAMNRETFGKGWNSIWDRL